MENAHTDFDHRLRAHGERLLKALEAQDPPETYAEILRAARALIAVKKALDLLHKDAIQVETKSTPPIDNAPSPVMNRHMRRRLEAKARNASKPGTANEAFRPTG